MVIRNTCANVAIVLTRVHNTQIELQEMRREIQELQDNYKAALQLLMKLVQLPEEQFHAAAIIREYLGSSGTHQT